MNQAAKVQEAKGPLVWLDMDQKALDDAYDQLVYAPNRDQVHKRNMFNSDRVRARLGAPKRESGSTGLCGFPAQLISSTSSARNHMRNTGSSPGKRTDTRPLASEANAVASGQSSCRRSVAKKSEPDILHSSQAAIRRM